MSKPIIVTEGKLDEILLRRILEADPRLRGRYEIVVGGGQSSAVSLARTYLATSDARVALITDADTVDPDKLPFKHSDLVDALGAVATASRYLVVLAVPEIEILLFSERKLADSLFGRKLTTAEWEETQNNPKQMLGKLVQGKSTRLMNLSKVERVLDQHDLKPMLKQPLIRAIEEFVLRDAA